MIIETCPKCGAELMNSIICTYPPIPCKDCPSCGWRWEGNPEPIKHVPLNEKSIIDEIIKSEVNNENCRY